MGAWLWISMALQLAGQAQSGEAHVRRASEYRQARDYPHAIAELRQALEVQPGSREAHGMLGEILLVQGFAADALPHLEAAGQAYLQALALLDLNRLPEALPKLLAESETRPDDPEVLFHLGE